MSKYDWSGVPDWVFAIATCQDGSVKVFTKPTPLSNSWSTSFSTAGIKPYKGNWKDSLEERPEIKEAVMSEMDKCREEFEKQRYWIGLFRTGVDFDVTLGEFGRYISNGTKSTDAMDLESFNEKWEAWANCWQHQQAKVEEMQRRNQMLNDNIKEQGQKLVYQNEVIETQAEKLLGLRDEKADLQKRVDGLIKKMEI